MLKSDNWGNPLFLMEILSRLKRIIRPLKSNFPYTLWDHKVKQKNTHNNHKYWYN